MSSFDIHLDRRVNSLKTALLCEKLALLSGFTFSYGPADEWPIYESDDFPTDTIKLLKRLEISVDPMPDEAQRPPNSEAQSDTDDDSPDPEGRLDSTVEDILGLYRSATERIVLFTRVINACSRALNVPYDVLYDIVLAHEIAHAVTHKCIAPASYTWKFFAEASSESKELLAQLIPFTYFSRQEMTAHLEVMEILRGHQRPKYQAYKASLDPFSSKKALPKLVIDTRNGEEEIARQNSSLPPEWNVDYQEEGQDKFSVRSTGVVFVASSPEHDIFNSLTCTRLPARVTPETLDELAKQVKHLEALAAPQIKLFSRRSQNKKVSLDFRINYGEYFNYIGKDGDWGGYEREFGGVISLVKKGMREAQGVTCGKFNEMLDRFSRDLADLDDQLGSSISLRSGLKSS